MYINSVKPHVDLTITKDTHIVVLKFKLDNILYHIDNKKVVKIEYHSPSIDNEGKIWFSKFELKMDGDLKLMWSTYHRYETNGLIKVDATITRSVNDIIKILKHPESSSNV